MDQLQEAVELPTKSKRRFMFSSAQASNSEGQSSADKPLCFLAEQNGYLTSTITCSSAMEKEEAIKSLKKVKGWQPDSDFIGLTVLRGCEDSDIE